MTRTDPAPRLTLPTVAAVHTRETRDRLALMRAMAADGIPVAEIAAALDYAPTTVRVMACRAGIQLPRLKRGRKRRARAALKETAVTPEREE